jgi:hypothetical protein
VLWGCLGFVLLADVLMYQQPLGINLPLTAGALLLLVGARNRCGISSRPAVAMMTAIAGLLGAQVLHGSILAAFLTVMGLITLALGGRHGWSVDAGVWGRRWLGFVKEGPLKAFEDAALVHQWRRKHGRGVGLTGRTLLQVCIPLAAGALFLSLFNAANPILADWSRRVLTFLEDLITLPPLPRFLMWVASALFAWALCRVRCRRRRAPRLPPVVRTTPPPLPVPRNAPPPVPAEPLLTARLLVSCLVLFNVLFALQNLLDARYLWYGASLPQGMTWAEYAHRGAYPLVATALLAAIFMLWAFHPAHRAGDSSAARRWVVLWVGQNVFLTVSAAWRLNLYIQVYSLTLWRVAAAVWMLLVVLGLVWILLRILRNGSNAWLVNVNVATLAVVLYACVFVDWAGVIAAYNVRHCREVHGEGPELDASYLQSLGTGTLPALYGFRAQAESQACAATRLRLDRTITALETQLQDQTRDWRGWTWQRHRIQALYRPGGVTPPREER